MGKINQLSFAVANLIAAGEVVDRPASVIKELLENAIDAGATGVTVEIQHGGVTFMRVADNGCGISPEDLPIAIRRHATSKIKDAADLDGIATLGFRGEALAAIAAVSKLRIITRTADAPYGSVLTSEGGEMISIGEQGCPVGTTVIVENLFGNVPARRKFLKKDVSEAIAVTTYVEKIALSRPDIAIRLIIDGNMKLDTAGDGQLLSAMHAVFGRDFTKRMIPVSGEAEGIKISGYIGRPDNVRPKRNYENFFINRRYVNCRTAAAALEQAYTSYIALEKFPACVLHIEINPAAVDVNVHPAKLEVKFSNERPVFEAVYSAVRTALEANEERPDLLLKSTKPATPVNPFVPIEEGKRESLASRQMTIDHMPAAPANTFARMSAAEYANKYAGRVAAPSAYRADGQPPIREEGIPLPHLQKAAASASLAMSSAGTVSVTPESSPAEPTPLSETAPLPVATPVWRIIGEAFHAYVIVERDDELLLIDKHAAHERVLFENLKKRMRENTDATQILMIPMQVSFSAEEVAVLENYRTEIEAVGFAFHQEPHSVGVSEIPEGLEPASAAALLMSLPHTLTEGTGNAALSRDILFEKALYQGACKAAIKVGREYPPAYVEWLCEQLMQLPDITVCPHGRPVAMVLSHAALDRQFKRT